MMMSLADIGNQISNFASPSSGDIVAMEAGAPITNACLSQSISDSFFELSSILWTTCRAYVLYAFVIQRAHADALWRRVPFFFALCCGVPLLLALLPLADEAYGPAGPWWDYQALLCLLYRGGSW